MIIGKHERIALQQLRCRRRALRRLAPFRQRVVAVLLERRVVDRHLPLRQKGAAGNARTPGSEGLFVFLIDRGRDRPPVLTDDTAWLLAQFVEGDVERLQLRIEILVNTAVPEVFRVPHPRGQLDPEVQVRLVGPQRFDDLVAQHGPVAHRPKAQVVLVGRRHRDDNVSIIRLRGVGHVDDDKEVELLERRDDVLGAAVGNRRLRARGDDRPHGIRILRQHAFDDPMIGGGGHARYGLERLGKLRSDQFVDKLRGDPTAQRVAFPAATAASVAVVAATAAAAAAEQIAARAVQMTANRGEDGDTANGVVATGGMFETVARRDAGMLGRGILPRETADLRRRHPGHPFRPFRGVLLDVFRQLIEAVRPLLDKVVVVKIFANDDI